MRSSVRYLLHFVITQSSAIVAFLATPASADTVEEHLFGSWGGVREYLDQSGIEVQSILTNDFIANVSGGLQRDQAVLGNYDLTATLSTEKAGLWNGGTAYLYLLGNYGDDPSRFVGDVQVSDNIEAYNTVKLYEGWIQQEFAEGKISLLAGLHDYNSEFYTLDNSGALLNSSFGVGIDTSQVGPSIFNTTALAVRLSVEPIEPLYIQSALYDGIPGSLNDPRGTQIILKRDDGLFWGSEIGFRSKSDDPTDYYKVGLGYWRSTTDFEDFRGDERSDNNGYYLIGEKNLLREQDTNQGLGIFFQFGAPQRDRNQFGRYIGAGFAYIGLIPDRDEDIFSFGFGHVRNSDAFKDDNPSLATAESVYELTYRAVITPWMAVQPDLQFIISPGTEKEVGDAIVMGARLELAM